MLASPNGGAPRLHRTAKLAHDNSPDAARLEVVLRGRKRGHGNNTGRKFGLRLLLRHYTPLRTKEGGSSP